MNILAICSALNNSYIAFDFKNKIISEIIKSDENYHSLYIVLKIKKICYKYGINLKDLDCIAVNCGPGSFTGIRVAMTIAKVMAGELDIPLIGLNSAEILLSAYNCDYFLADARRDMFFAGDRDKIELIYKNNSSEKIKNKKLLCDKKCHEIYPNSLCYETQETDLGIVMLNLTKEKYNSEENKQKFNALNIQANYIQTPPVF